MEAKDAIVENVLTMTDAFQRGDIPGILRTYERDAVVVAEPGRPLTGGSKLTEMFAMFLTVEPKFRYAGHDVIVAGDLALHLAPWEMTGVAPDGTAVRQAGLSVAVLRRQHDGRWLMVIDQPHGDHQLRTSSTNPTGDHLLRQGHDAR